jgi:hypothetical protein
MKLFFAISVLAVAAAGCSADEIDTSALESELS